MQGAQVETPVQILIVGGGAIGALYAYRLHGPPNALVSVVCRSNYATVAKSGFEIKSEIWGDGVVKPHNVFASTDAAAQWAASNSTHFHHVIVTTKALPDRFDAAALIDPVVSRGVTMLHLIQNGVGIEDPFTERFPDNPLTSTVTYFAASQPSDGVVVHHAISKMYIGLHHRGSEASRNPEPAFQHFVHLLTQGNITLKVYPNIQLVRWHKLSWNAIFNSMSIIAGCVDTLSLLDLPETAALIEQGMTEVRSTAERIFGEPIPAELDSVKQHMALTRTAGKFKPSMLMDWEARRPIEIQVILANAIAIAQRSGIAMPIVSTLHALLKALETKRLAESQ